MKVLKSAIVSIFCFFSFSCSNQYEIVDDSLPKGSIKLRYEIQEQIDDNLMLEITDINDYRCPIGAICSEPGNVKIDVRYSSSQGSGTSILYYSDFSSSAKNIDTITNYTIELIKVTPIPYLNKPIETDSIYSVYVLIDKI